jgi:hypothetical protein
MPRLAVIDELLQLHGRHFALLGQNELRYIENVGHDPSALTRRAPQR